LLHALLTHCWHVVFQGEKNDHETTVTAEDLAPVIISLVAALVLLLVALVYMGLRLRRIGSLHAQGNNSGASSANFRDRVHETSNVAAGRDGNKDFHSPHTSAGVLMKGAENLAFEISRL